MTEHLLVLQVILPMLAAPLAVLVPRRSFAWALTMLVSWTCLLISWVLLQQVLEAGVISYALGGWLAPYGIEYRLDEANAYVLLIVATIPAVTAAFARVSVADEVEGDRIPWFYAAWLLLMTGLFGITVTGDMFNVFVFYEVASIAAYVLIAMGRDRRALTASFRYLIMGTIGTTFILIGIGFLYIMTGTLNMADLAERLPEVHDTRTVRAAFAFLMVGICLKLALFPLHLWLPNAYTYAPSVVTAFMAATATKVAVYLLLRVYCTVFGAGFSFGEMPLVWLLLPLAVAGMVSPSVVAVFQDDVKRMLAYSSVAQVGYMILGVSFGSVAGVTAALLHLFNHALMKGALFLALGCIVYRIGGTSLKAMSGIGRRMPWTMAAFVIGGLSLVGIPLTVGFISKWYLIVAALERGWMAAAVLIVATSLLAAVYIWRVIEAAWFREPAPEHAAVREAPLSLLLPTWVLVLANIWLGIDTKLTAGVATRAAHILMGAG